MRVFFYVVTLQLGKLVEAEFAQSLSFAGVLPSHPGQIL